MSIELTKEEKDKLIAGYLETDAGKRRFRVAFLHGWPDFATALKMYYIPLLIQQHGHVLPPGLEPQEGHEIFVESVS